MPACFANPRRYISVKFENYLNWFILRIPNTPRICQQITSIEVGGNFISIACQFHAFNSLDLQSSHSSRWIIPPNDVRCLSNCIRFYEKRAEQILEYFARFFTAMPYLHLALLCPSEGQFFERLQIHGVLALVGFVHHVRRLLDVSTDPRGKFFERDAEFAKCRSRVWVLPVHTRGKQAGCQMHRHRFMQAKRDFDEISGTVNSDATIIITNCWEAFLEITQITMNHRTVHAKAARHLRLRQSL